MRILYSITKSEIGGAQVHVAQLFSYMKNIGYEVAVVSAPGGWLQAEAEKAGVLFYSNKYFGNSFNPLRFLKAFCRVKAVVSDFKPDIIHTHSSFAGIITRLVVRGKIPTIFTAHSWAFTDGAKKSRKIIAPLAERFVSKYTDKIIAVSQYDFDLALHYGVANKEKLSVIYNGVEKIEGNSQKKKVFVSVGRLAYPKNFTLLLEAFHEADLLNFELHIVGDGPDRNKIEDTVRGLDLSSRVKLLGALSQKEIYEKLLQSHAFALISKHEGFPISILEAMSAGLPVMASRVGGVPEQIDSSCGFLVSDNKEDVANAFKKLSSETNRKIFGDNARKKYEESFTLTDFLKNTEKIYKDVLLFRKNSANIN